LFSLREVLAAIQSFGKAHDFVRKHHLWKWILIPGLLYCLLFLLGIYFVWSYSGVLVNYVLDLFELKNWIIELENRFINFLFLLVGFAIRVVFVLLFLILGSPYFAFLSEKTEAILEGREFPFSAAQFFKDIMRGLRIAGRNFFYQTGLMLLIALLAFIPIIGWLTPMIGFFVECYFFGFTMMDYTFERKRWRVKESVQYINAHKGMAVGNGMVFYGLLFIPIAGWILAPAYSVIAATIHLHQKRLPNAY
jgi:CysZ protein